MLGMQSALDELFRVGKLDKQKKKLLASTMDLQGHHQSSFLRKVLELVWTITRQLKGNAQTSMDLVEV